MRPLRVAVFAAGLLFAQQATASSFMIIGEPPAGPSPSIIVLGEPAKGNPPVVSAPPDESIRTAALPEGEELPQETAAGLFDYEIEARAKDWPPPLSVSMVAFGEPLAARPATKAPDRRNARLSLPMVIRGGLIGNAAPVAATPSDIRPAVADQPVRQQTEKPVEPKAPAVAEQRESQPPTGPSRRDPRPEPAAPPPAPAPPPPPTQRLE